MSESSVYRILKTADLITSPAYVLTSASDRFQHPTERVHEMWQTAFSYFRMIGWGWHSLSSVLDDFSRYTCTIASSAFVTRQERCEPRKTDIKPPCYI